jgi:hypothetical protein
MENSLSAGKQNKASKIISVIFHPLFIPLYGLAIIFFAPTLYYYFPFNVKKILLLVILTNNILIPVSLMPFFRYRNIISSWMIETRRERIIPLLTVSLFYSITSVIMFRLQIPIFIKAYVFSISFVAIAATIINFWWKISLHSIGAGVLVGTVVVLSYRMMAPLTWFLISAILISGIIMSSRLRKDSSEVSRIYIGFAAGFAGMNLFMLFF